MPPFPPCPPTLKPIQPYLTVASEHDNRDPVISYWCRLYALEKGLKIDKKSEQAKQLLFSIMDWLENEKKARADNEAISQEIPAQAHLENYALKMFTWADTQDRAEIFDKKTIRAFYTSSIIYSLLDTFGELSEEVQNNMKYAKWKAAYINNCLKNGETPIAGPMPTNDLTKEPTDNWTPQPSTSDNPSITFNVPDVPKSAPAVSIPDVSDIPAPSTTSSSMKTAPEVIAKAQKFCKFASSALNYDDVSTAIDNLQKALNILRNGVED